MLSITDLSLLQKARRRLARHGWRNTLWQACFMVLEFALGMRILRGLNLERVEPGHLACDESYRAGFQSARSLRRFAADPANEMPQRFIAHALARGDACYAVCEGTRLVSSGWYSRRPTPIGSPELVLHFDPRYVYMYKGLTRAAYRGERLYAVAVSRALEHYLRKGASGFISYVDAANLDSLKACFRIGYQLFGSIYLLRLFGRHFVYSSPGCGAFRFRLEVLVDGAARGDRPERLDPAVADACVPVTKAETYGKTLFLRRAASGS